MRRIILVIVGLALLPVSVNTQTADTHLRMTTSEVMVDFVARDKHGHLIRDLKSDEVRVFENGVPQEVRSLGLVDGRTPAAPASAPAPETSSAAQPAAPAARSSATPSAIEVRDLSMISVVIANLDPRGRKLALSAMRQFVSDELRPNIYVGVFSLGLGGLRVVQPYTNNAQKITAAVDLAVRTAGFTQAAPGSSSITAAQGTQQDLSAALGSTTGQAQSEAAGTGAGVDAGPGLGLMPGSPGSQEAAIASFWGNFLANQENDVYHESMRFLAPLRALIQAQTDIPARKAILLFTPGLPVNSDTVELFRSIISTANRARVTIYAEDTNGINGLDPYRQGGATQTDLAPALGQLRSAIGASRRQQLMRVRGGDQTVTPDMIAAPQAAISSIHASRRGNMIELAEGTGGRLLPDRLDLREPLGQVMADMRTHYELSYSPTNTAMDGTFREIEVKVLRPGATVSARSGYYALPLLRGREVYPFENATLKAINTQPLPHQFPFVSVAMHFRPGPARTQMAFAFQMPFRDLTHEKSGQWEMVHLCVTALIKNEQGQIVEKISKDIPYRVPLEKAAEFERGVVSFTSPFLLPPGRYTLVTAAVDRQGNKASVSRSVLVVVPSSGLSMSDVAVVRSVDPIHGPANVFDPLQARGAKLTPELSDLPRVEGGQVGLYAAAYPPAPVAGPVEATIEIQRDGQVVLRSPATPVPPDAGGTASILANIPEDKLPPGLYDVRISFGYNGQTVTKQALLALSAAN